MIVLPSGAPLRAWREHVGRRLPAVARVATRRASARRVDRTEPGIYDPIGLDDPYQQVMLDIRRERERPLRPAEKAKAEIIREVQGSDGDQRAFIKDWGPALSKAEGYVARIFADFGQEPPEVQWLRAVGPNDDPMQAAKSFVMLNEWCYGMARRGEVIYLVRQDRVPESGVVAHESHHILVQRGTISGTSRAQMETSARDFEKLVAPQLARVPRIDIDYGTFALWMRR